jgi:hypothetical protein
MKAEEAKELMIEHHTKMRDALNCRSEYVRIMAKVESRAKQGKCCAILPASLIENNKDYLKDDGYHIEYHNTHFNAIVWADPYGFELDPEYYHYENDKTEVSIVRGQKK